MQFRSFNKNFRRNVTTTSPRVASGLCDIDELYSRGEKVFINQKCDCIDDRTGEPFTPGSCPVHSNAVLRARAWINSNRCDEGSAESEEEAAKIRQLNKLARETLRAADLKNIRKRMAQFDRAGKPIPQWMSDKHDELKKKPSYSHSRTMSGPQGKRVPRRASISQRAARRRASTVHWEEVTGPNGEIILFELLFENGHYVGRRRASPGESPQKGSIILDTTGRGEGLKVWRMRKTRRRPMPITPEMRAVYESSFLYKVRQLAAGQISVQELHDATRLTGPEAQERWSEPGKFGMKSEAPYWLK